VKNVSDLARDREIREFFSFSGEIEHVDLKRQASFFSFSNFLSDFLSILCTSRECYRNFFFLLTVTNQAYGELHLLLLKIHQRLRLLFVYRYMIFLHSPLFGEIFLYFCN
jgi:hypothetical protein